MTARNKQIEIASAIIGGIFTAIHVAVAIYLILWLSDPSFWSIQSTGFAALFEVPAKAIFFLGVVGVFGIALLLIAAEILPFCFNGVKAQRVIAIVTSSLLGGVGFFEATIFIGNVAEGLRGGNYATALLILAFFALAAGWFALNITKAIIYKQKD